MPREVQIGDWENVFPSRVLRHWNELPRVDYHPWKCSSHLDVAPGDMVCVGMVGVDGGKVLSNLVILGFCEAEGTEHLSAGALGVSTWVHQAAHEGLSFGFVLPHPSSPSYLTPNPSVPLLSQHCVPYPRDLFSSGYQSSPCAPFSSRQT